MPEFPAEIWAIIVEDLPPSSQRSCLSVSRLLHDIAIRPLFSIIKLHLCRDRDSHTQDILDRIVSDGKFAMLVKKLVVIADQVTEKWKLTKAIASMSQLVSFQWIGKAVSFPEAAAEAIASFCPQLRELALPVVGIVFHPPLLNLRNLRTLRGSWGPLLSYTEWRHNGPDPDIANHVNGQLQVIDTNQDTLRELHITSPCIYKVSRRIFDSLTHLEIYTCKEEVNGLPFIFRHAIRLESLTLVGRYLLPLLPLDTNTEILPSLSSFHLSTFWPCLPRISQGISNFIARRVPLQRLCLRLPPNLSSFGIILPVLLDLTSLRVLCLNMSDGSVDLKLLVPQLPPTLESLQLVVASHDNISFASLKSLPNLTFLHLFDIHDSLPITAQEMVHDMKHLHIVGRQMSLWDIVRVDNDVTLLPWNLPKKEWRVERDFPDDDIYWLFKYF